MTIRRLFVAMVAMTAAWTTLALPIQLQQLPIMSEGPVSVVPAVNPLLTANPLLVTNSLCEYYEDIVDQVMETMTTDILIAAQPTYIALQHDTNADSLRLFLNNLEDHFSSLRAILLTIVRPLVESNVQVALSASFMPVASDLTNDVLWLNRRISSQLGLMVSAEESAQTTMRHALPLAEQESKDALTAWLRDWLAGVEPTLRREFDDRVQDAILSIMEDFLVDE